jgi:hypothetical protein
MAQRPRGYLGASPRSSIASARHLLALFRQHCLNLRDQTEIIPCTRYVPKRHALLSRHSVSHSRFGASQGDRRIAGTAGLFRRVGYSSIFKWPCLACRSRTPHRSAAADKRPFSVHANVLSSARESGGTHMYAYRRSATYPPDEQSASSTLLMTACKWTIPNAHHETCGTVGGFARR